MDIYSSFMIDKANYIAALSNYRQHQIQSSPPLISSAWRLSIGKSQSEVHESVPRT